jgi:hypothetical protein
MITSRRNDDLACPFIFFSLTGVHRMLASGLKETES